MPSELLSHRLVSFRDRHGMTQAELAALLGVTARYLIYLENGTKDVESGSSLYKLFDAYESGQVPLDRQYGGGTSAAKASVREEAVPYRAPPPGKGLNHLDVIHRMREELQTLTVGKPEDQRRAYHFLKDVHMPTLAKLMRFE